MPNDNPENRKNNGASVATPKKIGGGMILIAWLILFGLLIMYFTQVEEQQFNPNQQPELIGEGGKRSLVLKANRNNHFVMTGKINGKKATLILDTGATNVAVPANMAKRLGLSFGRKGIAMTANGEVEVYATSIATLELGDITLYDVPADLNPGMDSMKGILLGMSALSQIEFTQRDGVLILSQ